MRVAIVGAGSIGGFFGAQAHHAGHEVLLCTRSPFDKLVLEHDGARTDVPLRAITRTADIDAPADWVLLATKAHHTQAAGAWLEALCGPETCAVAVLQNGVEHRERVAPFVGDTEVLPTTVMCAAEAVAPGHIIHHGHGRLEAPAGRLADELGELFRGSEAQIVPVDDFTTAVWHKLLRNIAANGLTALTGQRLAVVARPEIRSLAVGLLLECIAVANREGAAISTDEATPLVEGYAKVPPQMGSSMLYDRMAGRPLEWEALYGAVVRLGARHGIATPFSEAIAGLLAVISQPDAN